MVQAGPLWQRQRTSLTVAPSRTPRAPLGQQHRCRVDEKLSVARPTVSDMENNVTIRSLRVVDEQVAASESETAREEYWAQVQALRADLARLRPAN